MKRNDLRPEPLPFSQGESEPVVTTTDPVELERRLLRQGQSGEPSEEGTGQAPVPGERWTTLRKFAVALCLAVITGYLLLWAQNVQETGGPDGYIRGNATRGPVDFVSTLTGALVVRSGDATQLYDLGVQRDAQNRIFQGYQAPVTVESMLPYNHLPFEALAVAPLMDLPYPLIFALWTLLCGIGIGMSLGMLDSALPVSRPVGWVLSMAACAYLPLIRGLMLGQNSPLVLLGVCGVYVSLKRGQPGWAGAWLALAALKPQILPALLLLLALQKQWKTIAVFAGVLAAASLAVMPVIGFDWPLRYLELLTGVAGWSNTGAIDPAIMHNWRGFLTNLVGAQSGLVSPLFALLSLLTLLLVAWVWWRTAPPARPNERPYARLHVRDPILTPHGPSATITSFYSPREDLLWALAMLAAVLTSLHLNPHDLTLLVFPAWIVGAYATSGRWSRLQSRVWLGIAWVAWALAPFTLGNAREVVVPSVLLLAAACIFLAGILLSVERKPSAATSFA